MNSIDIIFVIFAAIFIIVGVVKGLVKSVIDLFSGIVSLFVALLISRPIAHVMAGMSMFDGPKETIRNFFNQQATNTTSTVMEAVNKIPIPEFIREFIMKDIPDPSVALSGKINSLSENLFMLMLTAVVFVIILIIVRILFFLLSKSINSIFKKIKFLKATNSIFGGLFGAINALLFTYIILAVIAMFASKFPDTTRLISESLIVNKLYMNNLLLSLLSR